MSSDEDFFDDEKSGFKKEETSGLMPIVELPSDVGSEASTARSEATTVTNGYGSEDPDETPRSGEESEEEETPRTGRSTASKRSKRKSKNSQLGIDMTPPDKLLKRAEKKAKHYVKDKKADKAIHEWTRCTALARIVHGDGHWKLADTYVQLADAYLSLKGYPAQAQYHTETAQSILGSSVQMSSSSEDKANILSMTMTMYYVHGMALANLKKFPEAEQSLNKSEKVAGDRAKVSAISDDDIDEWDMKIYMALAKVNVKLQKPAVATSFFDKALEVAQDMYGDDSTKLIPIYQGLGNVEQSKGKHADHEKAIEHYLQAHSIASKKYDSGSIELAETALALAKSYSKVGEDDAETSAESYLNECLAIYQSHYGPHHQKTLDIQDDLARLMVRTDRAEEAVSLMRSTIDPKKEFYGDFSSEVADTWKLIGSVYLSQQEPDKALKALKKCQSVESTLYGANHKKTKATQKTIDILLSNPKLAAKHKGSKADELKNRPRFNSIVRKEGVVGGCKSATY